MNLIDTDPFYKELGYTPIERQKNYLGFIGGIDDNRIKQELSSQSKVVVGSEEFQRKMMERLEKLGMVTKPKKRGRPPKD